MISDNSFYPSLKLDDVIEVNPHTINSQMTVMDAMARMNQPDLLLPLSLKCRLEEQNSLEVVLKV